MAEMKLFLITFLRSRRQGQGKVSNIFFIQLNFA
jgi:hypothetical protein